MPAVTEPYKTVISSHYKYAQGTDLGKYRDWRHIADLVKDDDTRVATEALTLGTGVDDANAKVESALKTATGMIEMAVFRGGRYTRADLRRMMEIIIDAEVPDPGSVTMAKDILAHLTCELAYWILLKRRKPDIQAKQVAGIPEAFQTLEALRLGEAIFPLYETTDSQATKIAPFDSEYTSATYIYVPISRTAGRMFGTRSRDLRS